ncbi:BPSL0761 family protein [Pseudomonas profundi]|uniref:BPSL0761 family protein n=1 Tax=Pseudomonas profundi TaxID=1981513 RepID=UPI00123851EA|nr:BPSL0761 family protein [Pseudomonas profundi]
MPSERTRSVLQTREFLIALRCNEAVSESIRNEANRLLRHYPTTDEVWRAARTEERDDGGLGRNFLSSSVDYS